MLKDHSFNPVIAKMVGVGPAVIYQNIEFWCDKNRENGRNCHDGRYWTYNSIRAWENLIPYMTGKQIRGALDKLVAEGLILSGNFNESAYDRTKWYCPTGLADLTIRANLIAQEGEPIPDNKPYNKPDNKQAPDGAGSLFSAMEDDQTPGTTDGSSQSAEKQEDPFETFWREFPPGRKTDMPKARKLFWSIVKGTHKTLTKATAEQLIDGAKRFARSEPDPQFTPMPTTWLNGERWTAEPEPQRKAVSSGYGGGHRYRPPTGEVVR